MERKVTIRQNLGLEDNGGLRYCRGPVEVQLVIGYKCRFNEARVRRKT